MTTDTRIVDRPEDMSASGYLRLFIQPDGDVIVLVQSSFDRCDDITDAKLATVEFCSSGAGGGASPRTIRALRNLAKAMAQDNADAARRKSCVEYDGTELLDWELMPLTGRESL